MRCTTLPSAFPRPLTPLSSLRIFPKKRSAVATAAPLAKSPAFQTKELQRGSRFFHGTRKDIRQPRESQERRTKLWQARRISRLRPNPKPTRVRGEMPSDRHWLSAATGWTGLDDSLPCPCLLVSKDASEVIRPKSEARSQSDPRPPGGLRSFLSRTVPNRRREGRGIGGPCRAPEAELGGVNNSFCNKG